MSTPLAIRWNDLCNRLGVKPRQFAMLLSVTVMAAASLGVKAVFTPAKANAAINTAGLVTEVGTATDTTHAANNLPRQRVEINLEERPNRDPFRPFFLIVDALPAVGAATSSTVNLVAPPSGLLLKAIIAGELAVIGEETVGIGDEIIDSTGRHFIVEGIQERRVVLSEGGRRTEMGYAAAGRKAATGAKGAKQ